MIILSVEKIKRIILFLLVFLLFYSRFIGLNWGLPYPFHPDERNMAVAVQQLHCDKTNLKDCFNPHFFAYGQFPLYLGYGTVYILKFFNGDLLTRISFTEAAIALRIISALASVLCVWYMWKIIELFIEKKQAWQAQIIAGLLFIFSPILIQAAHFGTTEALLMFGYTILVYLGLRLILQKISLPRFVFFSGLFAGLAIATKITALAFTAVPVVLLLSRLWMGKAEIKKAIVALIKFGLTTLLVVIIFSPYNLLSLNEFLSSMSYETAVAAGTEKVFYTRQFEHTLPIFFQFSKIFPYTLGWPILVLSITGFLLLPLNKQYNWLRYSFLIYFLPTAFLYAKWTRFMSPVMPVMIVVAVLMLFVILNSIEDLFKKMRFPIKAGMTVITTLATLILIFPGVAYLSIYQRPDARFTASDWINKNIPKNSIILSETANVVDVPLKPDGYQLISFNFYDLDVDYKLQKELQQGVQRADYIFIPSRRIFMNHPKKEYPLLNDYYAKLFSGKMGFSQVVEFSSYPGISFLGRTLLEFPDEQAEETWTVFDHPVIRIYGHTKSFGVTM